jgi:hypothetical protein
MTHESLLNDLWQSTLARLGGNAAVEASAREKGAFARARSVASAADLLRLVLAYCLGSMGLRSTSAWSASVGLADLSNVALLKRLRKCGPWMEHLASLLLSSGAQPAAQGRRIRLVDGTTVPKAGREAKNNNGMWRLHCAFDLPAERFSFIELTDEKGGERLDRVAVAKGDIVIADRGFMHPVPLAHVLERGADLIVRTPWKGARWYGKNGRPFDLLAALAAGETAGVIDRPIWVLPKKAAPLSLRLVALRKPKQAAEASRAKARAAAKWKGRAISAGTLIAAEWVILITSLDAKAFPAREVGELYRARWRIEMAFKRLKSLIGLSAPPSEDHEIAKTWILAHLLMVLLLEPHTGAPEIPPRLAA